MVEANGITSIQFSIYAKELFKTIGAGSLEEARMGAKKTTGRLCNSLRRGIHGDVEGGGKVEVRQNSELSFGLQGDSLVLSEQASIWSYLGEREF